MGERTIGPRSFRIAVNADPVDASMKGAARTGKSQRSRPPVTPTESLAAPCEIAQGREKIEACDIRV
jgi:hypothetical protein